MMNPIHLRRHGLSIYSFMGKLLSVALGFYFRRIQRFHAERLPSSGPVLLASNHPNSLTDAFVIGFSVPRKVNFVATVQLFRLKPLRWLLGHCGVVPVNRVKDDSRAMRSVLETFEACFKVLERGEAIGIFPEGITHDDPQLKEVKTGSARMALEFQHRHGMRQNLKIVPVGLTFSSKETYRSDVLVNFGDPIDVADFMSGYPERKHECIRRLTAIIELRIQELILHLPRLDRARLVEAVKRLYLSRLRVANRVIHEPVPPGTGELLLVQAIARAVDFTCEHHPERAASFAHDLDRYEAWLRRLNLSNEELEKIPGRGALLWRCSWLALVGIVLAPVAFFGWLHRLIPVLVIRWALGRFGDLNVNKTHVSTTAILAGTLVFALFYVACTAGCYGLFGWPAALYYGLSLPAASLIAHYYLLGARQFLTALRWVVISIRARPAAQRLLGMRARLISEIETARWEVPAEALNVTGANPL